VNCSRFHILKGYPHNLFPFRRRPQTHQGIGSLQASHLHPPG
jgi:hypothetical protein